MRYLYGDGSVFPLNDSFMATIEAVVDACTRLFVIDESMEECRALAKKARGLAAEEATQLQLLDHWVDRAVSMMLPAATPQTHCELAATEIAKSAAAAVERARRGITEKRDVAVRDALQSKDPERALHAIERLFLLHELPNTRWSVRWQATGSKPRAEIGASVDNIRARLSAAIADRSIWSGPIPVATFDKGVSLEVERGSGLLRKRDRVRDSSSKMNIILVEQSRTRRAIVVEHRSGTRQHILIHGGQHARPEVTPIDKAGKHLGPPVVVDKDDAAVLARLWTAVEAKLRGLIDVRSGVREAFLGHTEVRDLERPADFADALLDNIAPFVQEMRMRSRAQGELVLKRELGDGRREELFLSQRELRSTYSGLPHHYQCRFAEIGLGVEETCEFEVPQPYFASRTRADSEAA
jgi:hypothetical protein